MHWPGLTIPLARVSSCNSCRGKSHTICKNSSKHIQSKETLMRPVAEGYLITLLLGSSCSRLNIKQHTTDQAEKLCDSWWLKGNPATSPSDISLVAAKHWSKPAQQLLTIYENPSLQRDENGVEFATSRTAQQDLVAAMRGFKELQMRSLQLLTPALPFSYL